MTRNKTLIKNSLHRAEFLFRSEYSLGYLNAPMIAPHNQLTVNCEFGSSHMLTLKNAVFWNVMPWSLLEICVCFGGRCCLLLVAKFLPYSIHHCVWDSAELGNIYFYVYSLANNIKIMFLGGR